MTYEYYAALGNSEHSFPDERTWNLASGFVDRAVVDVVNDANSARTYYQKHIPKPLVEVPDELVGVPDRWLLSQWHLLTVEFTLLTPWYSKDDRPFHVLDNPVRKDRVFGVPFMAASTWKGLLRWACRMEAGLLEHLAAHDGHMTGWQEPAWILHLFGNERNEGEEFARGALQFFPTWFDRIGFEVINPHSRETRAGTQPIIYEVVPADTKGQLALLYAPAPGREAPNETLSKLAVAIEKLLTVYGFSAKRTGGWGLAEIRKCWLSVARGSALEKSIVARMGGTYEAPGEAFAKLLDNAGVPKGILWREGALISKTQFKKHRDRKPCTNQELEAFKSWFAEHGQEHQRRLMGDDSRETAPVTRHEFDSIQTLRVIFETRGH